MRAPRSWPSRALAAQRLVLLLTAGGAALAGVDSLAARASFAAAPDAWGAPVSLHARVEPARARLGERVTYRGWAVFAPGRHGVQWLPVEPDSDLTWGPLRARQSGAMVLARQRNTIVRGRRPADLSDTLFVEATVQAFRTGSVPIPGLRLQSGGRPERGVWRLPVVRLEVMPVVTAADTGADLRPLRGPLAAPWWERLPWRRVAAVGALLALALAAWIVWRRRRPAAVDSPAAVDPAAEALARLAELRALRLPEHDRFGDHAAVLTGILRRFLEATEDSPRPGDTTSGLAHRLEEAHMDAGDLRLLLELLRAWDRVKFSRAPSSREEALRSEEAVESYVRRRLPPPARQVA